MTTLSVKFAFRCHLVDDIMVIELEFLRQAVAFQGEKFLEAPQCFPSLDPYRVGDNFQPLFFGTIFEEDGKVSFVTVEKFQLESSSGDRGELLAVHPPAAVHLRDPVREVRDVPLRQNLKN